MTEAETKRRLNRNIRLFGIYKVFTKRVYLPIATIYATQQAGLNIQQIGTVAALSSLVSFLCDTPTGYWADMHGRKKSAQLGGLFTALGCLIFVVSTNFGGILAASLAMAVGYSFLNGAMEALIHDTLVVLNRIDDYAKVASQAQSLALVGNAALVALIPLLYPIDRRLPFVAGFLAYMSLFWIASLLLEPKVVHDVEAKERRFIQTIRLILSKKTILFFLCIGFVYAIGTGTSDVFNLAFIKLGMPVKYLGILFAASSLLGAFIGIWVHHLKRLSFKAYATFDVVVNLAPFIAFGIFKSLPIAAGIFVINFALWRYEQIMYQHYVLRLYGTTRYKATIISLMVNSRSLNEIWMALASTAAARHFGLLNGIGYASVVIVVFWPLLLFAITQFSANAKAVSLSSNQ